MKGAETIINKTQERFTKTIENFKHTISGVSLRPNENFFNTVKVESYGNLMPVTNCASVSIIDSKTLTVRVHDAALAASVYKAIQAANLGVTATMEGSSIRVIMPPMSVERRKSTSDLVVKTTEDSKIAIRNIRREENDYLKKLLKDKVISEDVCKKGEEKIQKMTDVVSKEIDTLSALKIKEIMAF